LGERCMQRIDGSKRTSNPPSTLTNPAGEANMTPVRAR
jgi:hypothetical protein